MYIHICILTCIFPGDRAPCQVAAGGFHSAILNKRGEVNLDDDDLHCIYTVYPFSVRENEKSMAEIYKNKIIM